MLPKLIFDLAPFLVLDRGCERSTSLYDDLFATEAAARWRQFVPQPPVSRSCFRRDRPYIVAVPCPELRPASASVRFPHVAGSPCFLPAACVQWNHGQMVRLRRRRSNGKIGVLQRSQPPLFASFLPSSAPDNNWHGMIIENQASALKSIWGAPVGGQQNG